ncbi:MAG: hypothetical protein U0104_01660 [Gemmatimonadales bacterium]|nr:hypothetical protein [Gemmatimonadales bacterium]
MVTAALLQGVSDGPSVGQLLVMLGGSIPILGILGYTTFKILGPIAQAFARRIGGGGGEPDALRGEVDDLRAGMDELRHQLMETQERLDFTERLLARQRAPEQLPGG